MSHHVHLLPGIIPMEGPRKTQRKRKLRKSGVAGAAKLGGIEDLEEIFAIADEDDGDGYEDSDDLHLTGGSVSGWFSGTTMKALLQAQEER